MQPYYFIKFINHLIAQIKAAQITSTHSYYKHNMRGFIIHTLTHKMWKMTSFPAIGRIVHYFNASVINVDGSLCRSKRYFLMTVDYLK